MNMKYGYKMLLLCVGMLTVFAGSAFGQDGDGVDSGIDIVRADVQGVCESCADDEGGIDILRDDEQDPNDVEGGIDVLPGQRGQVEDGRDGEVIGGEPEDYPEDLPREDVRPGEDDGPDEQDEDDDGLPDESGWYIQQPQETPDWTMGYEPSLIPSEPIDIDAPDDEAMSGEPAEPPSYFNPRNMIDGFLILAEQRESSPGQSSWSITPNDDLYLRTTQTDNKPGIDLIWPGAEGGGNYYTHLDGELTDRQGNKQATFWIDPRDEGDGTYWRYFDSDGARFLHWVGLEVPTAEDAETASNEFMWQLVEPERPPRDWRAIPQVLRYQRSGQDGRVDQRNVLIYLMPVDSLPRGYNPVELRLVHRRSGVYLGMDRHMMYVD